MSLSLEQIPLFSGLTSAQREQLAQRLQQETFSAGDALFQEGQQALVLHIIESGYVRLLAREGAEIALLTSGVVGDMDLLLGRSHLASAIAVGEVVTWALSNEDLEAIISADPGVGIALSRFIGRRVIQLEDYLLAERVGKISNLSHLTREEQSAFIAYWRAYSLSEGRTLFQEGDNSDWLYLLEDGTVQAVRQEEVGKKVIFDVYPGELLGTLPFLTGRPYNETAQAISGALFWRISRADFQRLSEKYPAIPLALSEGAQEPLSPSSRRTAVEQLEQLPLFQGLGKTELSAIVDRLLLIHAPKGRQVFRAGDAGSALYFVESGEIEIRRPLDEGGLPVTRLFSGNIFGEVETLTGKTYSVDAIAAAATNLWLLYRRDLDALAVRYPEISLQLNKVLNRQLEAAGQEERQESRLQQFPIFQKMPRDQLRVLLQQVQADRYDAGEMIYQAGKTAEAAFIIDSGRVRLQEQHHMLTLRPGDVFGLEEVLQERTYFFSAQAIEETDVFQITPVVLRQAMFQYPVFGLNVGRVLSDRVARLLTLMPEAPAAERITRPAAAPAAPAVAKPQVRIAKPRRAGFLDKVGLLPTLTKIELGLAAVLLIWLIGVSLPSAVIQQVHRANQVPVRVTTLQEAIGNSPASYPLLPPSTAPTPTYTPMPTSTPAP